MLEILLFTTSHEVRRDVALVEAHALGELELEAEGVALLDGDDTFLADLVHRLGDDLADLGVRGRDRRGGGDLLPGLDGLRLGQQLLADGLGRLLDALLQAHRVGAGRDVAQTLTDESLSEHGRGGGAVTGYVVGLLGNFLDELGPDLLVRVLELDLLGDGDTVVGDRGGAPLLLQHDVAALGAERHLDGIGEGVHPSLEAAARFLIESNKLGHSPRVLPRRVVCSAGRMPATDGTGVVAVTSRPAPIPHRGRLWSHFWPWVVITLDQ
jgi:hypothetical protein